MVDYLMEQANVVHRMNPLILNTDRKYLDFTTTPGKLYTSISRNVLNVSKFIFFFLFLQL